MITGKIPDYPESFSYSDLLFLLNFSDTVHSRSTEAEIHEYACSALVEKWKVAEAVIYSIHEGGPVLEFKYPQSASASSGEHRDAADHFHLYKEHPSLFINDIQASPHVHLFSSFPAAIMGILHSGFNGGYLVELRDNKPCNWEDKDLELLHSAFKKMLAATGNLKDLEKLRHQNSSLETTANALGLSVWRSFMPGREQPSELDNIKYALLKASLPKEALSDISDEDLSRVEIEITKSLAAGKDFEIEYQTSGPRKPQWIKLHGGQLTDVAGRPHFWGAEMDISKFKFLQEALIKDKKNQEFLLKLTDELSTIADPAEVQNKAAEMLGKHFGLSMAYYSVFENGMWTNESQYRAPGISSRIPDKHSDERKPLKSSYLKNEKTFVSNNLATDSRLSGEERQVMTGNDVYAVVITPIFSSGSLIGAFIVAQNASRTWTEEEIIVIKEVVKRTQGALVHSLAQKDLRESERKYRTIFNADDSGFILANMLYDSSGKSIDVFYEQANPAAGEILGRDYSGKYATELGSCDEEIWDEVYAEVARTRKRNHREFFSEKDKKWFILNVFKPESNIDDHSIAIIFQDITERKEKEEKEKRQARHDAYRVELNDSLRELSDPNQILSTAMQLIAESLKVNRALYSELSKDEKTLIYRSYQTDLPPFPDEVVIMNPETLTLLKMGLPMVINDVRSEKESKPEFLKHHPSLPVLNKEVRDFVTAFGIASMMVVPIVKNGEWKANISVHCSEPTKWTKDQFEFLHDMAYRTWITFQRAVFERELEHSRRKLEDNLNRQKEFMRIATHEVRSPLTVIQLAAHLLKERLKPAEIPETYTYIEMLNSNVGRLSLLFEDLINTTQLAEGTLAMNFEEFDLERLIAQNVTDQQALNPAWNIRNNATKSIQVMGDRNRMGQVITNLLSNAIKYTEEGTEITIETSLLPEHVQVSLKDNGPGIPAGEDKKIFKRFYRVDKTSQKREGLGLGLYISKMIVKMHGGNMWVESTPGEGATFYFTIPTAKQEN